MTKNSIHSLSDPRFLEPFRQCRIETQKKDEEKKSKRKALHGQLVSAVKVLRMKLGHEIIHKFEQCDKNECGALQQYKKQPKDKAMPKDLIGRRERCVECITRPSPTASPNPYQNGDPRIGLGIVQSLTRIGLGFVPIWDLRVSSPNWNDIQTWDPISERGSPNRFG